MNLSVLLCTVDRPQRARQVVADVLAQWDDGVAELVIVDQSAEALALPPLPAHAVVHHLRARRVGLPRARNIALDVASSALCLFVDDDVRLLPGCVAAHSAAFRDPRVGVSVGRLVERHARPNALGRANRVDRLGRVHTQLAAHDAGLVHVAKGANMAFRCDSLRQVGGFDARFAGNALLEDADASERMRRAGWSVRFEPQAELVHLSEPAGGVRQSSDEQTSWWRFHNTALFVTLYRRRTLALARAAHRVLALRLALRAGNLALAGRLNAAFEAGVKAAATPRQGYVRGDSLRYAQPHEHTSMLDATE